MAEYGFKNDGLPIVDSTGAVITLNSRGQPVDHIIKVVTITTDNGLPNYGVSPPIEIPQPYIPIKVASLIYFVTYQDVRNNQSPTTTSKFARTPVHIN